MGCIDDRPSLAAFMDPFFKIIATGLCERVSLIDCPFAEAGPGFGTVFFDETADS